MTNNMYLSFLMTHINKKRKTNTSFQKFSPLPSKFEIMTVKKWTSEKCLMHFSNALNLVKTSAHVEKNFHTLL